jgi:hypothetical protein
MSCENTSNRVARLACRAGLPRLASKHLFYLGAAAGIAGGLVLGRKRLAQATARARFRLRRLTRRLVSSSGKPPALIDPTRIPEMGGRRTISPTPRDRLRDECTGCGSSPAAKPGAWYVIDGQAYCQDCAPQAAGEAGARLESPAAPTSHTTTFPSSSALAYTGAGLITPPPTGRRAPMSTGRDATPLDPDKRVETTLQRKTLQVKGKLESGEIATSQVEGYEILARNRYGQVTTGLGIAHLEGGWSLTHLASGSMIAGLYETPVEAQQLACVLAQWECWTAPNPTARLTREDLASLRQTIHYYNSALAEARAQVSGQDDAGVNGAPPDDEDAGEELLYDRVASLGHQHGFQRGYNEGAEQAMEELGFASEFDAQAMDEELSAKEEQDLSELNPQFPGPAAVEVFDEIYTSAVEEGYDEGWTTGYEAVMARFGQPH